MMLWLTIIAFTVYLVIVLLRELHHLQLNSYRNERYLRWWPGPVGRNWRLPGMLLLLAIAIWNFYDLSDVPDWSWIGAGLLSAFLLFSEKKKKPLVLTKRATRLLISMLLISTVLGALIGISTTGSTLLLGLWILGLCAPGVLLLANSLLRPVEKQINNSFIQDAQRIIKAMPDLKIVAITGSYGKTSVKHFLTAILSEHYNVLMTPGSYNTTMGVVRTVREMLKPTHEVFVVEMGAKQSGDIAEICAITPPERSILTAVGPQHLETFGSIENVQQTKFEIVEALPEGGTAYLNADYELVQSYPVKDQVQTIYYSVESKNGVYRAENLRYEKGRLHFEVVKNGEKLLSLETQLLGQHNASNLLVCTAVALDMGVAPNRIAYAVRQLQPVEHRLQLRSFPGGYTVLDDAFNSNPTGAKMALEVLQQLEGNRKIIITPGMIELGAQQYELNKTFGKQIAGACDYVILVGPKQTEAIQEGLRESGYPDDQLYVARNLEDANGHLRPLLKAGDVVLYENDLPDTYNE
jgi:UDP-N-acetylmuramoyl-tripeptide--D-alanyl-D-alanine ligase